MKHILYTECISAQPPTLLFHIGYFSVTVTKHHDQQQLMGEGILADSSRGKLHNGRGTRAQNRENTSSTTDTKGEENGSGTRLNTLKALSSNVPLPARLCPLKVP